MESDKTLVLIKDSTLQLADLSRIAPVPSLIRKVQSRLYDEVLSQLP